MAKSALAEQSLSSLQSARPEIMQGAKRQCPASVNTLLTKVLLSNLEADPDPSSSLKELQSYMTSVDSHNTVLSFVVDIYLLRPCAPFTDAECLTLMQYPASAQVGTLNLSYNPVNVTPTGLGYIAQLRSLAELVLTCCEDIDDNHMRLLSALTNLERLSIGPLKRCTSEGLIDGLSTLTRLQELYLIHAVHIKDETIAHISCSLSATLQALSMADCPQLTDECMPYLCMPHLSTLFFSNSSFITLQGVEYLASQSSSLVDIDFAVCTCLSVADRMKLQQVMLLQQTVDLSEVPWMAQ